MKKFENFCRALVDRNNVAHAYNEAVALSIIDKTKCCYYKMFCAFKENAETNWLSQSE